MDLFQFEKSDKWILVRKFVNIASLSYNVNFTDLFRLYEKKIYLNL